MKDGKMTYKERKFVERTFEGIVKFFIWFVNTNEYIQDLLKKNYRKGDKKFLYDGWKLYDDYTQDTHAHAVKIFRLLDFYNDYYFYDFIKYIANVDFYDCCKMLYNKSSVIDRYYISLSYISDNYIKDTSVDIDKNIIIKLYKLIHFNY